MRLRIVTVAALALTVALPALAQRGVTESRSERALESLRAEILFQAEEARPFLGDEAVELLQERARFARRIEQLELVADDGLHVMDEVLLRGADAGELLLRSPSAILLRDQAPRAQGKTPGRTWTRGSWMDSPDGAS